MAHALIVVLLLVNFLAILHLSKGINTQNSSSSCSSCGCPPGFSGTNCDVPVMKVVGSITYKIDATDQSGFNETLFTARVSKKHFR